MAAKKTSKLSKPKAYGPLPHARREDGLQMVQAEIPSSLYKACSLEAQKRTLTKRQMMHYGLECFLAACNPALAKKMVQKV